jgi:hypothetical protein
LPDPCLAAFLRAILEPSIGCCEVRVLDASMERDGTLTTHPSFKATFAAWFHDPDEVLVAGRSIRDVSAYITVNPIKSDLLARSNTLSKQRATSTDADVIALRNVLLDFDAKRPSGISSTDEELAAALARRDQVLADHPEIAAASIHGCSGNGGFILVVLPDLPNDEMHRKLVKEFVDLLAAKYTDQAVELDRTTFNPARIMALVGTRKCKGVHTTERPHRMVTLDSDPSKPRVPLDLLDWLEQHRPAQEPASEPPTGSNGHATGLPWSLTGGLDVEQRAMAYLATCDAAKAGEKGHNRTFNVAVKIGPGFDLPPDVALRLLKEHYNPRCEPPWNEKELDHKVRDAYRRETRRGWLLQDRKSEPVHNCRAQHTTGEQKKATIATRATPAAPDARPRIEITFDEHLVVDQALDAIKHDPALYQRGHVLAMVTRASSAGKKKGVVERPNGSVHIQTMPKPILRRIMSTCAQWGQLRKTDDGKKFFARDRIPGWSVDQLWDLRYWPGVRHLEGIVEAPTMRPDGSLLTTPGYDDETGLLYLPSGEFPPIPDNPDQFQAMTAAADLLAVVNDFPFPSDEHGVSHHRHAYLAALLTPLVRPAIEGPCPVFLLDANVPGTGKNLLCDVIGTLATGRQIARSRYTPDDDEMEKRLLAIALAGDPLVLFDEVPAGFSIGNGPLNAALTAMSCSGRILGESRWAKDIPLKSVFFACGNNIGTKGDALRRAIPIRLETKEERPEERTDITNKDLLAYVRQERGRLVAAVLTLVRAYVVAGRPDQRLTPMDFPTWCGLVRNAVHWTTGNDPCKMRTELIANDEETAQRHALLQGFENLCSVLGKTHLTTAEMVKTVLDAPASHPELHALFVEWTKDGKPPSANTVGKHLGKVRRRVIGTKCFDRTDNAIREWFVRQVKEN